MRHIVMYDDQALVWAVVDTAGANLVISVHHSRRAAAYAAAKEEAEWPPRPIARGS